MENKNTLANQNIGNNNQNQQPNIKEFYNQSIITPNAIPQLCKEN